MIHLVQLLKKSKPISIESKSITCSDHRFIRLCFSKAQELIGNDGFNLVYNYLHDEHQKQFQDPTRSDEVILSGLQTLSSNQYACTLINELVLHECLNELNERTQTY